VNDPAETRPSTAESAPFGAGEATDAALAEAIERHRRELHVYCYRMTGSLVDAEDLLQETLLRAWRSRRTFAGRASLRSWLYRIATNVCLDALAARPGRPLPFDAVAAADPHGTAPPAGGRDWLEPYPDQWLAPEAGREDDPEAAWLERETLELAFMAAIAHLPPKQRAVVILRDVGGWSAQDVAKLLDDSVPAVKSALQRGRQTLREKLPRSRTEWRPQPERSPQDRAALERYMAAVERRDKDELAAVLRADVRACWTPAGIWTDGAEDFIEGTDRHAPPGEFRTIETHANGQPAVGIYLRAPDDDTFRRLALEVLTISDGQIVEIADFSDPHLLDLFGLPAGL
jgi:RNA polymerase sigma-70 factor (ECF subfamily)